MTLILCGDGSADLYAQQVGAQLGQLLGIPVVNCVSKITVENGSIIAERTLEHEVETLEIPMPAVISVTSDINLPRIAGMKQILAAGKKPAVVLRSADLEYAAPATIDILETLAPKETDRKHIIIEGDSDEAIAAFIANVAKSDIGENIFMKAFIYAETAPQMTALCGCARAFADTVAAVAHRR